MAIRPDDAAAIASGNARLSAIHGTLASG